MGTSTIRLRSIKSSLPFSLPLRHSRDKLFQALSRFSVLEATESWAGPGNEAMLGKSRIQIVKMIKGMELHHSRWADNWILTLVPEVYGVWNLATNYHGAYFLSFIQTSSLFQAPIQAGLAPDCVEETLYFTNIYFS